MRKPVRLEPLMELEKRRRRLVYPCPSPGGNDYEQAIEQNGVASCKAKSTLPCKQSAEEPTFETTPGFRPVDFFVIASRHPVTKFRKLVIPGWPPPRLLMFKKWDRALERLSNRRDVINVAHPATLLNTRSCRPEDVPSVVAEVSLTGNDLVNAMCELLHGQPHDERDAQVTFINAPGWAGTGTPR